MDFTAALRFLPRAARRCLARAQRLSVQDNHVLMGFTLTVLFEAAVLILNALTVLNEPRFLVKSAHPIRVARTTLTYAWRT